MCTLITGTGKPANGLRKRVLLLGATGTIGRATASALVRAGHDVTCFVRQRAGPGGGLGEGQTRDLLEGATLRFGNVTDITSLRENGFNDERFDVVVSCLASRTGEPKDAWAVDHHANLDAMQIAKDKGVEHFVLLSAICVQKPRLEFQRAKLAAEKALANSGMTYTIVRPTAFFKSLSGQISRLQRGKAFLVFGDGRLTSCKPISDRDLGSYLAGCINDTARHNKVLPIGGPGPAITPKEQGDYLFSLLERRPRFKHVPVTFLDTIIWSMGIVGRIVPSLSAKVELARIGRYYATESMLALDPVSGEYDAAATPETGEDTLFEYYERVLKGEDRVERGDHSVF